MTAVNPNKSRHAMGPRGEPIEKGSMELLNGSNLPRFKEGPFFFFFSPSVPFICLIVYKTFSNSFTSTRRITFLSVYTLLFFCYTSLLL